MSELQKDLNEIARLTKAYKDLQIKAKDRARYLMRCCIKIDECVEKYDIDKEKLISEAERI